MFSDLCVMMNIEKDFKKSLKLRRLFREFYPNSEGLDVIHVAEQWGELEVHHLGEQWRTGGSSSC